MYHFWLFDKFKFTFIFTFTTNTTCFGIVVDSSAIITTTTLYVLVVFRQRY